MNMNTTTNRAQTNGSGTPPTMPAPPLRFRDNCVALVHFLINVLNDAGRERVVDDADPVMLRAALLYFEHGADPEEIIDAFITYTYPYWKQILEKDETFFLEHADSLFHKKSSSEKEVNVDRLKMTSVFKALLTARKKQGGGLWLSPDKRAHIWKIVQSLVKISLHHVSESRKPFKHGTHGDIRWSDEMVYTHIVEPLPTLLTQWGIPLANLRV
jgi:hypothetical protein